MRRFDWVTRVDDIRLNGEKVNVVIPDPTDVAYVESVDEASRVDITFHDPRGSIIRSAWVRARSVLDIDGVTFELAGVTRESVTSTVTFRDQIVVAYKQKRGILHAVAGVDTRGGFARRLIAEVPGVSSDVEPGQVVREQIGRGSPDDPDEDSWAALASIAQDVAWRRYAVRNRVRFGSDEWIASRLTAARIREHRDGIDELNWAVDIGTPLSDLSFQAAIDGWWPGAGHPLDVVDVGLASGRWIVGEVTARRSSGLVEVRAVRPQQPLPEPEPDEPADHAESAGVASGTAPDTSRPSARGHIWPCRGTITGRFGDDRGTHRHAGLDIAANTGVPVVASADGTVVRSERSSSYGEVIYLAHASGVQTRYAHLSARHARHGQRVDRGQRIGAVGSTGRSSGPHLHFEVRERGVPRNPLDWLPAR